MMHTVFNNIHPVFNKHSATLCALLVVLQHLHFLVYMPYRENTIINMQFVKNLINTCTCIKATEEHTRK